MKCDLTNRQAQTDKVLKHRLAETKDCCANLLYIWCVEFLAIHPEVFFITCIDDRNVSWCGIQSSMINCSEYGTNMHVFVLTVRPFIELDIFPSQDFESMHNLENLLHYRLLIPGTSSGKGHTQTRNAVQTINTFITWEKLCTKLIKH